MSKVIKSPRCVSANPCQLPPVEMDAFFITDEEDKNASLTENLEEDAELSFEEQLLNAKLGETSVEPEDLVNGALERAEEIVTQAKNDAEQIILQAQSQRDTLLEQAKQEAVQLKDRARREGLAEGRETALQAVHEEWKAKIAAAAATMADAEREREKRIASSEAELLKLAGAIAELIIGEALRVDADSRLEIVRRALARVATADSIKIKINPEDFSLIQEAIPELQQIFSEPKKIAMEADSAISQGSCFINTEHGNVDARVKSQLDRIMTEIMKAGATG